MIDATYVLPLKAAEPATELDDHLTALAGVIEVVVVDGSPAPVFDANAGRWRPLGITHVPVDDDLVTPMGKVGGVLTGARRAGHDVLVIADDDVRWTAAQLHEAVRRLGDAAVLRPQNHFVPRPWHARWDTGRVLIARATGGDWPGTLVLDRRRLVAVGGYDGSALFENLELVRTLRAAGGTEVLALDLVVARRPPTTAHFWGQRTRQAYDEWARPGRLVVELALLPALALGRVRAAAGLVVASVALAEVGRRRGGGTRVFGPGASLWAPCWVAERAVTSWLALGARLRGGARYGDARLPLAAHTIRTLRRRLAASGGERGHAVEPPAGQQRRPAGPPPLEQPAREAPLDLVEG